MNDAKKPEKEMSAAETYAVRKQDIESLLYLIQRALVKHAENAEEDPQNWALVGDLGRFRSSLIETLQTMIMNRFGDSEEKTRAYIEEQLVEMRGEE